ncbi:MAG TPA: YiiX/YebB-like N1pC/P60 family cysteine hydrolase [Thermoanaerobaculaceae bacterium]|nr:YiiX/YebB-like N1pC/P60 family cysteine hydrolase [Thermoanaerobaculaceae bacterium]
MPGGKRISSRTVRLRAAVVLILAVLGIGLLLVPARRPVSPHAAAGTPFAWHEDARWEALEAAFLQARSAGCEALAPRIQQTLGAGHRLLDNVISSQPAPQNASFDDLERTTFDLGSMVAACPQTIPDYLAFAGRMRSVVKRQSRSWGMGEPATRDRLYRLLYGGRAAVEEAMLQAPRAEAPALLRGEDEPSSTPSAEILGVRIHSGDILVSRGGAPTSALIARGSDYPGNFSHVALVHVDGGSGAASVVEAHIERGVAVATLPEYLKDVKLRVMVLRLRADLPQIATNPNLPHEAATAALADARRHHIAYDFAMDFSDHRKLFCSEVASAAYEPFGITLWMRLSTVSSPGLARWLAGFGVTHFRTQEPSDLEYDPQLVVVAEWRDPATLFADHVDNAVVDAMLEGAERGATLDYPWSLLAPARLAKFYSCVLNAFGLVGPVPEGLSAEGALRTQRFDQIHAAIRDRLRHASQQFERVHGYVPPYWELVKLAREASLEIERRGGG